MPEEAPDSPLHRISVEAISKMFTQSRQDRKGHWIFGLCELCAFARDHLLPEEFLR
jgi:hypothetical protein